MSDSISRVPGRLKDGVYDHLLDEALAALAEEAGHEREVDVADLDPARTPSFVAAHLRPLVERVLDSVKGQPEERQARRMEILNQVLATLADAAREPPLDQGETRVPVPRHLRLVRPRPVLGADARPVQIVWPIEQAMPGQLNPRAALAYGHFHRDRTRATPGFPMLYELLSAGYFPKELPPCFTTDGLGPFAEQAPANAFPQSNAATQLVKHSIVRAGASRRLLGIPHPRPQFHLCRTIAAHWNELTIAASSPIALSAPRQAVRTPRAIEGTYDYDDIPAVRARVRARSRYILNADVSNFYSSLYTHAIPWALHTKPAAKVDRSDHLLGNVLDAWVRRGQHNQTMGLPVGPDTSFLIAEVVLAQVDKRLHRATGFRYFDDYELGFPDPSAAEQYLSRLEEALGYFELTINPRKTRTIGLPTPMEPSWTSTLRHLHIRPDGTRQATDLLFYFDRMSEFATQAPNENVIHYGMGTFIKLDIDPVNHSLYFSLLMQAANAEPGVLRFVLQTLLRYEDAGAAVPRSEVRSFLDTVVRRHAPLGHGSEVAWALWGALSFGTRLSKVAAAAISRMDDSIVALLAFDAFHKKLLPGFDPTAWRRHFTKDGLLEDQWLLAYEAAAQGWTSDSHLGADPTFKALHKGGVTFYNPVTRTASLAAAKAALAKKSTTYD